MGAGEQVKGKVKGAVGGLTDDDALEEEGRAQEKKGQAERRAGEERAKAKAHEAKAREKEMEQDFADTD
ncbi:MAG TPA: CsbD family protein [Acidimicrobiales bacterium]|nr:CsbD family protein [Acidimicrobiales bacterium]